jgi:glycosyltransferase involved in cell wall biosynthesis
LNQRLHILFICSWYPSRILPNNGDFIQRHAEAVSLNHSVTVVHVVGDNSLSKTLKITDKNINNVRTLVAYFKTGTNPLIKSYRYINAYFKLLKRVENFDLVHLNVIFPAGIIAFYLKYFKKVLYIISEHWHGYHRPYCKKIGFGTRILSKLCTRKASVICPVTDNLGESMQLFGLKGRYRKISNVVDTSLFKPAKKKDTIFKIVHISSMDKVKNVPSILNVISKLQRFVSHFKFYLIGNNANDFKALSLELGINKNNIVFVNQVPQKELVTYLQQADVLVLFSATENAPCVVLEAFSCGIPVISTDVGGVSEHFPKNFGTLIPKNDSEALLKTLVTYSKQPEKSSPQDMHNYIAKNFSPLAIAKQFTKVYLSVLKM